MCHLTHVQAYLGDGILEELKGSRENQFEAASPSHKLAGPLKMTINYLCATVCFNMYFLF